MTRLLLVTLVVAAVGAAAVSAAEARNKVLRRSSYAKAPRAAKKSVPAKKRAARAWSSDRCSQEAGRTPASPPHRPITRSEPPAAPAPPAAQVEGPWRIAAGAAAGGNAVGMRIARSEGGGGLGTALSAAYGVSGMASVRLSGKIRAGAVVDAVLTGPLGEGMQYRTTEETAGAVPFQHRQVDARGELAYSGGIELAARAGYHYAQLTIDGASADIPIVGEAIGGYLVGMAVALPMDRVALSAALDVMPSGVQAPTQVTDGMLYGTAASGAWASAGLSYRVTGRWLGTAGYRYGRSTIALTDGAAVPSTATRTDQSHTVLAGIGLSL